jgi:carbamoyl-phosphate synthase large subunit
VDAISDGEDIFLVAMEQIEEAGVHSGDSACVYPPQTLSAAALAQVERYTRALARRLQVRGLMNVQYAVREGVVYLLEVNARASRTVPFASKASGAPLAPLATRLILGAALADLAPRALGGPDAVSVKGVALPFTKFPGLDPLLGPEMKSTGESMGSGPDFATAFLKAQDGAGKRLAPGGAVAVVADGLAPADWDRLAAILAVGARPLIAPGVTAAALRARGLAVTVADTLPAPVTLLVQPAAAGACDPAAGRAWRREAVAAGLPCAATLRAAAAWLAPDLLDMTADPGAQAAA